MNVGSGLALVGVAVEQTDVVFTLFVGRCFCSAGMAAVRSGKIAVQRRLERSILPMILSGYYSMTVDAANTTHFRVRTTGGVIYSSS